MRTSIWTFEGDYRALTYGFRVRSDVPGAAVVLGRLLAPFRTGPSGDGLPTYTLVCTPEGERNPYALYLDENCIQRVQSPGSMVDWLIANVTREALESTDPFVTVHAGVASWNGVAVVLPAPPDSGKTTLTAGLVSAGFEFLSDEAALVDPRDGLVHPFPRPILMDSLDVIPGLRDRLPPEYEPFVASRHHLVADDLRPGAAGGPCRVGFVVAPRYEAGTETALEPVSRAEGLRLLAANAFNLRLTPRAALRTLADVASGARCYRLRISDLGSAVEMVLALVRGRSEGSPGRPS